MTDTLAILISVTLTAGLLIKFNTTADKGIMCLVFLTGSISIVLYCAIVVWPVK